jgi:hypothetical protein
MTIADAMKTAEHRLQQQLLLLLLLLVACTPTTN